MGKRGSKSNKSGKKKKENPTIAENRRARFQYEISDTLEVGIMLVGTEVKSVRDGNVSIAEGYIMCRGEPPALTLHNVTIGEYQPAGQIQHRQDRTRKLLARGKEIKKLARQVDQKGVTIVPLKMYFKGSWAKLLIGVGTGKATHDKRRTIKERTENREIRRAMSKHI